MKKMIFLLGGYDLEMMTIKGILDTKGIPYRDKNLSWGAKLSAYKEDLETLEEYDTVYGIELIEDITPPKNYIAIDHHGDAWRCPSSLEQVAKILGIRLDCYEQLVAANDKGHIAAMRAMGASDEEISEIRKQDRMAQGVSEDDEKQAKMDAENVQKQGSLYIVETTLERFSPLADILLLKYKKPLVIYNKHSLVYYGDKVLELAEEFSYGVENSSVYYGGNPPGYIGFSEEFLVSTSIEKIIQRIEKVTDKNDELYSYHTFMFPFSYEGKFDKGEKWRYIPFQIKSSRDYNEFIYFYGFAQDAIYNEQNEKDENIARYYEFAEQDGTYIIHTTKGKKRYDLELDGISLRVFESNRVAILGFNLKNTKYSDPEDILIINDFGRRIYPQFLDATKEFDLDATKGAFLACKIGIEFKNGKKVEDDFSKFTQKGTFDNLERTLLPKYIGYLIEDSFKDKIHPIIDDRMYTISIYLNDALSNKMKKFDEQNGYAYENDEFWYRYVFVDGGEKTCQSRHMTKELIKNSTYDRWVERGTLFGISRYSFVALTGSWYGKNILIHHMQTIYFQMFTLLLAYRAMILNFSKRVTKVLQEESYKERKKKAEELFKDYLFFKNNIYFQEITAQDQGIELFDIARKQMRLDNYLHELDHDIDELHNFIQIKIEDERNEQGLLLNKLAGVFLPPSLLAGIFGMNTINFAQDSVAALIGTGSMVLSALLGYFFVKSEKVGRWVTGISLVALFLFASLCMPTATPQNQDQNTTSNKGEICRILK